ncbi:MAG: KOW domain-containing RNA-binding protein [Clostridiaceae bacterium]|jgi:ribosomal protein L14E/L6E/L27E|nr:KOW domain-containing RNA-binding protein [Clostridiaceae bacterium]
MQDISLGQIVISTAGRDKDCKFIVLCIIDEKYVYISDGDIRKVEKPKRKKIKHLRKLNHIAENIRNKLEACEKLSNSEIRKLLKSID